MQRTFAYRYPDLSKSWHPAKNGTLTPWDVSYGTNKKVWWICEKGHEWQATVANRNKSKGCPYCLGIKASPERNLAILHPDLAHEWNYEKNAGLIPEQITPGSGKKVWWRCVKGHEWQAAIYSRVAGNGCPFCAGKMK